MTTAGHRPQVIAAHLVAHAPTLDAFAAGLTVGIDDPDTGLSTAARCAATGHQLAAASEAYGLSPAQTANTLHTASAAPEVVLDAIDARCDHDLDALTEIATDIGMGTDTIDAWLHPAPTTLPSVGDHDNAAALLAALPPPGPSAEIDPVHLLDTVPEPEPSLLEPSRP